jgi:hypothetical protein
MSALADINARLASLEHAVQEIAHFLKHMEGRLKFGIENTLSKQLASVDDELSVQLGKVNAGIVTQFGQVANQFGQVKNLIEDKTSFLDTAIMGMATQMRIRFDQLDQEV